MCIGETLKDVDEWDNTRFLNNLITELINSTNYNYRGSTIQNILRGTSIPFRHELCCWSKIIAHPLVDMEEGSQDLYAKTNEQHSIDPLKVTRSTCYI